MSTPFTTFPLWPSRDFSPADDLAFVIMPLREPWSGLYEREIKPVLREFKLRGLVASESHGQNIMDDIWRTLNESRLVIADITDPNPNVMYELGITHALGKPHLLLTADPSERVPFDIKQIRHIAYRTTPARRVQLKKDLRRHLRALLKAYPTGMPLLNYVEDAAKQWKARFHDPMTLGDQHLLPKVRRYLAGASLSPLAQAFCLATAAYYASVDNMIHWGRVCARQPDAAEELAFAARHHHRHPPLRLGRVIEQFPPATRRRVLARLVEQRVEPGLVAAIRRQKVRQYVRDVPNSPLTEGERAYLIAQMTDVVL
jgi:hypothetical protein